MAFPTIIPSTLTRTLLIAVPTAEALSTAHPEIVKIPDTAAPDVGVSIQTVGVGACTFTVTFEEPESGVASLSMGSNRDGVGLNVAVTLGQLGDLKGGKARVSKLTPQERRELARKAVLARWAQHRKDQQKPE